MKEKRNASKFNRFLKKFDFWYPLVIKLLFEFAYINRFSPTYSYMGYYYTPNSDKMWLSWIVAIIFALLRKLCFDSKLSKCFNLMLYLSCIPSLSIYWLKNENTIAFILIVIYWLIWWAATYFICKNEKSVCTNNDNKLFIPARNDLYIWTIFLFSILTTIIFSARYGGFRVFIQLADVYEYRLAEGNQMGTLASYIYIISANLFIPLCLSIHLVQKRYILFSIDIILMLLCYGIYGNKSMLFTVGIIAGLIVLYRLKALRYLDGMIAVFIISYLIIILMIPKYNVNMITALGSRMLVGPPCGQYYYYDFFSQSTNPYLFLRESIFRHFAPSPYSDRVSVLIGSSTKYFTGHYNNMNNGLMAIAFANFGFIGVVFHPVLLVNTLKINLRILNKYNEIVQYILLILHVIYLISTTYFSWLVSGGLLLEMLILYFLRKRKMRVVIT